MIRSNKLPQKKTQTLNQFKVTGVKNRITDTDTPSSSVSSITSTHIFMR